MVWKGDATGRLAKSLITLIDQVDDKWPNRAKHSDGSIGDRAHAARVSDHNPGPDGVVEALDITHDPAHGVDTWKLAEILRQNRDPRIKYVISNGRIFSSVTSPWQWRAYTGSNKHAHHIHISVKGDAATYDRAEPWALEASGTTAPAPALPKPRGVTDDMRQRMMKVIMGYEGRIPPQVFIAPDGRPEIAGITHKDHPQKYAQLKRLLDAGEVGAVQAAVVKYYLEYTAPAQNWTDRAGLEFFLRDCILNRGPTGAAEILQDAVDVEVDGEVGPTTRGALAALNVNVAIDKLRAAREDYEDRKYPYRRGSGQWRGMLNRWNKAQSQAKAFQKEQGTAGFDAGAAGTVIVVGGGTAAAAKQSWTWAEIGMVAFSLGVAALIVFLIVRNLRRRS